MELCSICNKNLAVVYINKFENGKSVMKGVCMDCAKSMGLPVMDKMMKQLGMTEEEFSMVNDQMKNMLENMDVNEINEQMQSMMKNVDMNELKDSLKDSKISADFLSGMFPNMSVNEDDNEDDLEDMANLSEEDRSSVEDVKSQDGNKKGKKKKSWIGPRKKHLDKYGINLTMKAMDGKVDRIIGRNREIDRVVQILNRRSKNNPILIGEPGVGKTAIAEGLAVRIVEKQVPEKLLNSEVYLLDMTAVVAGTQFRGQFESRMKNIIDEVKSCGNVILVIDEVHNIMGAGEVQGGAMNAANILKPSLARGEIQLIGATTTEEYRKHIEKDSALERRFQPVLVEEPSVEESIEILKGIKDYYENYHKVSISDEVIKSAVDLSKRYITDRKLPDKAIDVIDEAGSRANLKNKGLVEIEALKQEYDTLKEKRAKSEEEKEFEKSAEYKVQICRIEEKIKKLAETCYDVEITIEDIAYVIEAWTKIPVNRITEEEAQKLLSLEDRLHKRVVGQNKAISSISKSIRRNRSGFRKKKKPSSFIFVGPTGVGKTEVVKSLAFELFGSDDAMIRLDMSEYMEKHTASKLIGAPPGYVGYDQGGFLTEKVRRKPYSVILLDEIEKAHPDVFNMLLQILEDGRLTDNQGRTTFFENCIIVMTSNAGSNMKTANIGFSHSEYDKLESKAQNALKQIFRPEFLNRIDETIVFTSLNKEELKDIIELMIKEVKDEAKDNDIRIDVTEDVKDFILEKGYDEKYGARPLRRCIERNIEDAIAEEYLKGNVKSGDNIKLEMKDEKVKIVK
ncbi:ATP-dependent Clp protease ATP-binding subunit [Oceanirhabdus seepicola]|uniref:ATP-dependent Clp protease ATP-binding subunit n=1 Tax=Oceanirhabdus seepicola TaxID=2828781 RepID=A0A9J6P3M4_9CLOT|nr:ATP-dependent Clp protease ATP-binding subunit [Oceanirhabdus seepicola]MCM1990665.1 ATP-dependent Clp protease ATP-binding subunit [Oceanirhabdus seepicola]